MTVDLARRIEALSPEKRRLLEMRARKEGLRRDADRAIPRRDPADPGPWPLTWGMQRLWFVEQLAPGTSAYNIPFAGRLRGALDPRWLGAAFLEVVRRHEVLRTRFAAAGGRPVQVVDPPPGDPARHAWPLPVVDLSALPPGRREAEAELRVNDDPQTPFDLARGPVLRVSLLRLAPDDHWLVVTMPHIVTDAWSMAVLFRELPPIYDALRRGRPSPLPELAVQVADYAVWQRRWLTGSVLEEEMAWWRRQLAGAPTVLEIPTDRPRPAVQSLRGVRHYLDLPPDVSRRLRQLAERDGATTFMALLAVFNVLLLRWTGERDQLVATPVAVRSQPETHGLIGFFIDNLVLRTDLAGDPTFRELLARVREMSVAAFAHGELPFDKVLDAVGVERDLSRPPLVQVNYVLQNVHIPEPEFEGIELAASQQTDARSARFDLTVGWFEWKGGLRGAFEYAVALYDRTTMMRMANQFRRLVDGVLADPERPVSELPLLSAAERHALVVEAPPGPLPAAFRPAASVLDAVRRAAAADPDALAVAAPGGLADGRAAKGDAATAPGLTYGELVVRAEGLARRLLAAGVAAEEPVGVLSARGPELAVGLLGTMAAGAAYVPLDPDLPPARLAQLVADAGVRRVVAGRGAAAVPSLGEAARLPAFDDPPVPDETAAALALARSPSEPPSGPLPGPSTLPLPALHPDRLAYVLHTSGSTGEPKGVAVSHGALASTIEAARLDFRLAPGDRVLHAASPGFDASLLELLPALVSGAAVEPADRELVLSGPALVAHLARRGVTAVVTAPSLLAALPEDAPARLPALSLVVVGGEAMAPAAAAHWTAAPSGGARRLLNSYGPTEAAVAATVWEAPADGSLARRAALPLGRPLPGAEVLVLDAAGRPAPLGVPGELCLGGSGLARGYLGRPAATAAAFVPHPSASRPGERLYRTGDRARRRPDGGLELLGRLDAQVKVRGQRIEPGEVEAALTALPPLGDAVVGEAAVGVREVPGGAAVRRQLVAWVAPAAGTAAPEPEAVRAALALRLPDAMVPARVVVLSALPRTASGKIDRAALPAPAPEAATAGRAPEGAAEIALAAVWCELLGVERVGPEDDFFALGGDSIASIQVISGAAAAGLHLEPKDVFGNPTLAALARAARPLREAAAGAPGSAPDAGPVPLTPVQRWFLGLELAHPEHWNMSLLLDAAERPALDALGRALAALETRHDALRLTVGSGEQPARDVSAETPRAVVVAPWRRAVAVPVVDLAGLPPERAEGQRRVAAAALQGGLDLGRSPWRPALLRGPHGDRLLLTVHHLAVDAVSWRVLLADLESAYVQAAAGGEPVLPPVPVSFRRHAEAVAARTVPARAAAATGEAPEPFAAPLPVDAEDGDDVEATARHHVAVLPGGETAALERAVRSRGGRLEEALVAAVGAALAGWSGHRAVVLDVEGHGRGGAGEPEGADLSRTVGWLTTVTPVRWELPAGDGPEALLAAGRDAFRSQPGSSPATSTASAPPAPSAGPSGAGSEAAPAAPHTDVAASPRPPVSFNFLGRVDALLAGGGLFTPSPEPPQPLRAPANRRPYRFEINAWVRGGALTLDWRYGSRRHRPETVGRLAAAALATLRGLAALASQAEAATPRPPQPPEVASPRPGGPPVAAAAERELPLSFAQERLWFLDRLEPGNPAYNVAAPVLLRGRLDRAAFAAALARAVARHEALRTTFPAPSGRPVARVLPPRPAVPALADLAALPPARRCAEAERLFAAQAARPFDLARGPLLRALLVDLGAGEDGAPAHALHLLLHHIVADGWSVSLLVREVAALYAEAAAGVPARLPAPGRFGDHVLRERRRLSGERLAAEEAWWRERLAGLPPALELPAGRPRPPLATSRGAAAGRTLAPELTGSLHRFARAAGATPFMVLLAGLEVLLARLSGQRDFAVGTPIAGRGDAADQATLGLFLNHLVLRSDLAATGAGEPPGFRELVARVRSTALAAFAHAELPFERVVEAVAPERDLSRTPLFQVFFNMLSFPPAEARLPGLTVEELPAAEPRAMFDWTLYAKPRRGPDGETLHLELVYNADLFDAATAEMALAQYETLLARLLARPEEPVGRISLRLPLGLLPDPAEPLDDSWPGPVHAAVEARAAEAPGALALTSPEGAFTYGELAAAVRGLAGRLAAAGVGRGDVVAIHAARVPALVAAVLAVHRAGAAFLLLDPAHPPRRNADALAQAQARVLLALEQAGQPRGELAGMLAAPSRGGSAGPRRLDVPTLAAWAAWAASAARPEDRDAPAVQVGPSDAAVVTFTSGSSGRPKGVLGLHRSLTHFLPWQRDAFGFGPRDRFSLVAGLSHDPLQREMFTALWLGATLCLPEPADLERPGALARWMAGEGITVAHLAPAMARLLAEIPRGAGAAPAAPPRLALRAALFVGDVLTAGDVAGLRALAPEVEVINLYGSTETQRAVGFHRVAPGEEPPPRGFPLGRGMPGAQLLVLAPGGVPAGVGEVGEVCVRGPHLAAGYLGDPAATAERFVPDPAGGGGRLYRTGDLGRHRRDGEVVGLGRRDAQLKVRGFRIEPAEVEAALAAHPAVREAAVGVREAEAVGMREAAGRAGGPAERRLVAWIVAAGEPPAEGELRAFLRERLPEPMVPTAFVTLPALPLTPNRKLDRAALPAPAPGIERGAEPSGGPRGGPPRTPTERRVAAVWSEVLGVPEPGREDDFFALGGHSLKLIQVLARLVEALGVEVPVRAVFEQPTLAALARRIDAAAAAAASAPGTAPERPPLVPVPRQGRLPVSFQQRRLLFIQRLDPQSTAYNVAVAVELEGALDEASLGRALGRLLARHEALRTSFCEPAAAKPGGEWWQRVEPVEAVADWRPARLDLTALPGDRREAAVGAALRAAAGRPFDLSRAPLLRALLVRAGRQRHVLALVIHHAVADGWSVALLLRDGAALYQEERGDGPAALPDLPLQYADWAAWQRRTLGDEALAPGVEHWRRTLEGVPPLELPTDRPRPAVARGRGGRVTFRLPASEAVPLARLAAAAATTPYAVLMAAWQALLGRLAGQPDFAVGTPMTNRHHPQLEPVVGFFADTLALRADFAGEPTFAELVGRVRGTVLDAFAHQDVPFERVVAALDLPRDRSRAPVFQAVLVLDDAPLPAFPTAGAAGLASRPRVVEGPGAAVDLRLAFHTAGDELAGMLEYDADLFDRATAERWARHLRVLAAAAAERPDVAVAALPLLVAAERRQLLEEWRGGRLATTGERTLPELFAVPAAARPQAVAVGAGGVHLSYGELDRRSAALARRLRRRGVVAETPVGLLAERSAELAVAILGILRAGGAYVPLDPEHPAGRRAAVLADAGARLLVASLPAEDGALDGPERVERVAVFAAGAEAGGEAAGAAGGEPLPGIAPDQLAYVIYTSGSTGAPKGVGVSHRAVSRLLEATAGFGFGPADAWTLFHSPAFDFSVWELWGALAHGGRVVPVPRAARRSPAALLDLLAAEAVTVLDLTPSAFAALAHEDAGRAAGDPPRRHRLALRHVIFGGEALDVGSLAGWIARRGGEGARLTNMYGITETTVHVTERRLGAADLARPWASPVGRPLADLTATVVDRRGEPVPVGVPGELLVGGPGLARGYLGRPGLTAERFVPDPFAPPERAGGRLYRSGDRVRWRPSPQAAAAAAAGAGAHDEPGRAAGELDFLGRLDRQVQVRGFRVEPGEVEAALVALPEVSAAAIVPRDDVPAEGTVLVAWWVPAAGPAPAASARPGGPGPAATEVADAGVALAPAVPNLRAALARTLPAYMLPARFVAVDELPRTPNGKTDRRALAERPLPGDRPELAAGYAAPRDPLEEVLAAAWAEVLGVERVGIHDGFFDLGGHSLAALRLVARIRETLGAELPVADLFAEPTVAATARRLAPLAAGAEAGPPPLQPLPAAARQGDLPASFAQERVWFLERLDPRAAAYNVPAVLRLDGPLDAAALARALTAVAGRHEALRTALPEVGGAPVQRIAPALAVAPAAVDLSALPAGRIAGEAVRVARDATRRPFDLARGPLLRAVLARLGGGRHRLVLVLHHAVCDEQSLAVLLADTAALYRAAAAGEPARLAPPALQYADWAAWQRRWLQGEALDRRLEWWRGRLAGLSGRLELPLDRPRPVVPSGRGLQVPVRLPGGGLRAAARAEGATPFMAALALFAGWLSRYGNEGRQVVGTPVDNRGLAAAERSVGYFVNTLALVTDTGGDPSFGALVARSRDEVLAALAHAEMPFEKVVEAVRPVRGAASPLVEAMLSFHAVVLPPLDLPGLEVAPEPLPGAAGAKFDLLLQLGEEGVAADGFAGQLEVRADLFDRATAERMAGHLAALAAGVAEHPERCLSRLPLLAAAERRQLLEEWRGGRLATTGERTLPEWFAAQASARPEAVAVGGAGSAPGGFQLTYGELERRAAALARRLRRRGVAAETPVGLLAERSADLVVAILGILAAGGTYVPLDPEHPAERHAAVLEDAGARLLVSASAEPAPGRVEIVPIFAAEPPAGAEARPVPALGPLPRIHPDQLAYVIYTSGSTGRPKGVVVSHRAVSRLLESTAGFGFGAADVWTLFHSPAFDVSVWEVWGALAHGGRLVPVPAAARRAPGELLALLAREGVTVLGMTPSAFTAVAREDAARAARGAEDRLALRLAIFAGEALDVGTLAEWIGRRGDGRPRLVNMYGITEITVHGTERRIGAADLARPWASPVGRTLGDLTATVVDRRGEPVPAGVAGELLVGGPGLARGYRGRPGLTAERFVPDPFAPPEQAGRRLYRSGDRVRWVAPAGQAGGELAGELEFLGRLDRQVQLRGYRVEPGEVEAALAALPEVAAAAVVVRDDLGQGGPALVAWWVPSAAAEAAGDGAAAGLRAALARSLPAYMLPARFVALDELPRTPNGKTDRRALAERPLPGDRPELAAGYAAPRTPLEEVLAAAWAEALGVERVGVDDGFFDLGGHSLLATRMVAWVRETFEVEVPLGELFVTPTVAGLAAVMTADPAARHRVERTAELLLEMGELDDEALAAAAPGAP